MNLIIYFYYCLYLFIVLLGSTRKGPISLQGYLQQVSELIQNKKSKFFRTNMRTKDQTWSVVVFNTELRQEFINMEKNK